MAYIRPLLSAAFGSILSIAVASEGQAAELYIAPPDNAEMSAMFHSPSEWQQTRRLVTGIVRADHTLNQVPDKELAIWFQRMGEWNLRLELEVGVIKEWSTRGDETYRKQLGGWQRVEQLGGHISSFVMDGPLAKTVNTLYGPEQYAIDETVKFIGLVREHYPGVRIGDTEPFPGLSIQDHARWLDGLNGALARNGLQGLDFYRLDVNWVVFITEEKVGWLDVAQIERICHERNTPFGLIYWASDYALHRSDGLADDETWSSSIMAQGYNFAAVGGRPDQYVVESWIGAPSTALPDSERSSFAGSVLQLARRFMR